MIYQVKINYYDKNHDFISCLFKTVNFGINQTDLNSWSIFDGREFILEILYCENKKFYLNYYLKG